MIGIMTRCNNNNKNKENDDPMSPKTTSDDMESSSSSAKTTVFVVASSSKDSNAAAEFTAPKGSHDHDMDLVMMTEELNTSSLAPHPVSPQPSRHPSVDNRDDRESSTLHTETKKRRRYNNDHRKSIASSSSSVGSNSTTRSSSYRTVTTGRWNPQEHATFLQGLTRYGRDWKQIARLLESRTPMQVRSHAQKFFAKQQQQQSQQESQTMGVDDEYYQDETTTDAKERMLMMEMMTPTAARILAEPETVEREVQETLQALHERYQQLQQRLLQQQQQSMSLTHGMDVFTNNPDPPAGRDRSPDEWIAMQVLRDFSRQSSLEPDAACNSSITSSTSGKNPPRMNIRE
jgi:SHAQKYF class myb-like DNA-binding protein